MVVQCTSYTLDDVSDIVFLTPPQCICPDRSYIRKHMLHAKHTNNHIVIDNCAQIISNVIIELCVYIHLFLTNDSINTIPENKFLYDDALAMVEWLTDSLIDDKWNRIYGLENILSHIFKKTLHIRQLDW